MTIAAEGSGTATYLALDSGATSPVSDANEARVRYNTLLQQAEISQNTGAYQPISTGIPSVAVSNTAALLAFPVASLADGSIASMHSVMALWELRKTGADFADGITVLTANGGGRWYRMRQQNRFWQLQTTWHINETTGNDENDGLTGPTALQTFAELVRRWAAGALPSGSTYTVNIDSNLTQGIDMRDIQSAYPTVINIIGARTVLYVGSVTAKADWQATPVPTRGTITDAALPVSFTASGLMGQMIVMTSGAANGYTGWIQLETVAKTAQHSVLFDYATLSKGNPGVGDTFRVVSLRTVTGNVILSGPSQVYLFDLQIIGNVAADTSAGLGAVNCSFGSGTIAIAQSSYFDTYSSRFAASISGGGVQIASLASMYALCDSLECKVRTTSQAVLIIMLDTVSQYKTATVSCEGQFYLSPGQWWGMFDVPAATAYGLRFTFGERSNLSGLYWGLGNAANYGVQVDSGIQARYVTVPTFGPNAVKDVLVGTAGRAYSVLPVHNLNTAAALVSL